MGGVTDSFIGLTFDIPGHLIPQTRVLGVFDSWWIIVYLVIPGRRHVDSSHSRDTCRKARLSVRWDIVPL